MKKLVYILAVSVLASCAFADLTITDWEWDDFNVLYIDYDVITDYAPPVSLPEGIRMTRISARTDFIFIPITSAAGSTTATILSP